MSEFSHAVRYKDDEGVWHALAGIRGETGATGPKGDTGAGVPTGGTAGQVLRKKSGTDYDTEWGSGGGGTSDFNDLTSRPSYSGTAMTGSTNIPEVKTSLWDAKQDAINDLATIRTGAAAGATALQSVPATYRTAAAQDAIDAVQDTSIAAKYEKPASGIPKTDLASAVQASLGLADTALQSHQSLSAYRTSAAQDVIDAGKQATLVAGTNITIAADGKTISASAAEPAQYLKDASVSGNTLTLTKKDGSTETFTPTSGGTGTTDYTQLSNKPSINSVQLSGDKSLADIGAAAASHTHTLASLGAAASDHTHTPASIGAAAESHTHTPAEAGAAAADHTHTPASIGAAATSHTHTPASIGAAAASHTHVKADVTDFPTLAAVATSGSYSDLSDTPALKTVATTGAYSDLTGKPSLAAVATSGAYTDLSGKPTLATVATSGDYEDLENLPALKTVATTGAYSDLSGTPNLATVATTGAYTDLSGKPALADVATTGDYEDLDNTPTLATVATSGSYNDLNNKPTLATVATSGDYDDLDNTPALATVATSGSYTDLSNKPTIPGTYVKRAAVASNTLTLTNADNTTVAFAPSGSEIYVKPVSFSSSYSGKTAGTRFKTTISRTDLSITGYKLIGFGGTRHIIGNISTSDSLESFAIGIAPTDFTLDSNGFYASIDAASVYLSIVPSAASGTVEVTVYLLYKKE